jgi:ELWxxDGT repeat protein
MNRLHHHPRQSRWSRICKLLVVLTTLASVSQARAATHIRLIKDINLATQASLSISAGSIAAVGNILFFRADDGEHGWELWKSDGTQSGTIMVKDINPTGWSEPDDLTAMGGTLFFVASDGMHGRELWTSSGSAAGTTIIKDITPGAGGETVPGGLTAVGNILFFSADDGVHGRELWTSDGTAAGTTMVQDLSPGTASADPSQFTRVGTTVFFTAQTPATGRELWAMNYYQLYLPLTHRKRS